MRVDGAVSVLVPEPEFGGEDRLTLMNADVADAVCGVVALELRGWWERRPRR